MTDRNRHLSDGREYFFFFKYLEIVWVFLNLISFDLLSKTTHKTLWSTTTTSYEVSCWFLHKTSCYLYFPEVRKIHDRNFQELVIVSTIQINELTCTSHITTCHSKLGNIFKPHQNNQLFYVTTTTFFPLMFCSFYLS